MTGIQDDSSVTTTIFNNGYMMRMRMKMDMFSGGNEIG